MTEEAEFEIGSPEEFNTEISEELIRMVSAVSDETDGDSKVHVTVERRVWEEQDRDVGRLFEHLEDGRQIETYKTGDGDWAVDLHHDYGCTRIALGDEDDVEAEMLRKIREEEPNRDL